MLKHIGEDIPPYLTPFYILKVRDSLLLIRRVDPFNIIPLGNTIFKGSAYSKDGLENGAEHSQERERGH